MKLYLMRLATLPGPDGGAPVPAYLVQTDDGVNVLIDTGVPRQAIGDGDPAWSWVEMDEDDYVVSQLASIGLAPDDIDYLVATHYDGDHAGNHDAFPDAELVVQRVHHETAAAGAQRFQAMRAQWDRPDGRIRLVDGDAELLPGIELIETGGHVPGHQSVLVRLPETGPVILAIDAVPHSQLMDPDTRAITEYDAEEAGTRASTRKLVDLAAREGVTLFVHGHDGEQWAELRLLPEFYS